MSMPCLAGIAIRICPIGQIVDIAEVFPPSRKWHACDLIHNQHPKMNRLASILPAEQVLVNVEVTSKKRAFEDAGLLFESLHGLSRAVVTDSLFARERLGSTGLGHGVAIPHGRIKGLKSPMAAVFQLANPIGFDSPDEQPVGFLIFLLVPEAATEKHLEILSEIAELLSDAALRETLKSCKDATLLHQLIANWHPASAAALNT